MAGGQRDAQNGGPVVKKSVTKDEAIKYASLVVLVVQNTSLVLFMRFAMTGNRPKFLKTITVFFGEIVKFFSSIVLTILEEKSVKKGLTRIYEEFFFHKMDTLKVLVPAAVYTVQNFLLYLSVAHLPATTYMVTYQLKVLTTALFTRLILGRKLSVYQWLSLVVLFSGVCIVQYDQKLSNDLIEAEKKRNASAALNDTLLTTANPNLENTENSILGFCAVLVACILSGFAGIYFEKILKGSNVSIWIRNVQLALPSIFFSLLFAFVKDNEHIFRDGYVLSEMWRNMLYGFDWAVWVTVLINAGGGLIVAVVIKFANNIAKAFATSVAIVLNCVLSYFLFDFRPSYRFLLGAACVMVAVFVYSKYPYRQRHQPLPQDEAELTEKEPKAHEKA